MKIYVFDSWRKFWGDAIRYWQEQGHEVKSGIYWGPELVEWSNVSIFHPVDNNLKQASIKQEKPAGTIVIAEAVDIDIYSGHMGGVNWASGYVDALVFYADHMKAYTERVYGKKIPATIPRYIVPGGIDLKRWTLIDRVQGGYNVAWIGRLWIAKNLFGALQVFNQLIKTDPGNPWRLHCLGKNWSPPHWWRQHCEGYLAANPELAERVTFTESVPDVNEWLTDKDYLLQTSVKESFGYVIGEAAAKGIRPVIQNTMGATDIWPREWIFDTHDEAVEMLLVRHDPAKVRGVIKNRYPLEKRLEAYENIWSSLIAR